MVENHHHYRAGGIHPQGVLRDIGRNGASHVSYDRGRQEWDDPHMDASKAVDIEFLHNPRSERRGYRKTEGEGKPELNQRPLLSNGVVFRQIDANWMVYLEAIQ